MGLEFTQSSKAPVSLAVFCKTAQYMERHYPQYKVEFVPSENGKTCNLTMLDRHGQPVEVKCPLAIDAQPASDTKPDPGQTKPSAPPFEGIVSPYPSYTTKRNGTIIPRPTSRASVTTIFPKGPPSEASAVADTGSAAADVQSIHEYEEINNDNQSDASSAFSFESFGNSDAESVNQATSGHGYEPMPTSQSPKSGIVQELMNKLRK